jgi:hypothetical protein
MGRSPVGAAARLAYVRRCDRDTRSPARVVRGFLFGGSGASYGAMATANAMLEHALTIAADTLAQIARGQPHEWDKLCRQEPAEVTALLQFHSAVGVGDELVPQVLLGRKIIELMVDRHPDIAPPDGSQYKIAYSSRPPSVMKLRRVSFDHLHPITSALWPPTDECARPDRPAERLP